MSPEVLLGFVLMGVLLPAVVSGVLFLGLKGFAPRQAGAIALTGGFLAGFIGISGLGGLRFPPQSAQQWLPVVALLALGLGLLEPFYARNLLARWGVRLGLLNLLLWRLFQGQINHPFPDRAWSASTIITNFVLITLVVTVFWWALDYLLDREYQNLDKDGSRARAVLPTALVFVLTGSALAVVFSKSAVMGQLTGALTAALGAVAVVAWLFKGGLGRSASPVIALITIVPWLSVFAGDIVVVSAIILALTPWLLVLPLGQLKIWQQALTACGIVLLPMIAAVVVGFNAY